MTSRDNIEKTKEQVPLSKPLQPRSVEYIADEGMDETSAREADKSIPPLMRCQADEQVVFLSKGPFLSDGTPHTGPVVGTKGGIAYVVGGSESDFTKADPAKVKRLLTLQEKGLVVAKTPQEIYEEGVGGDRTKIMTVFTSGGEGSSIGVNIARVANAFSDSHVIFGLWQGFKSGVLDREGFKNSLVVVNDPDILKRMQHTGGSPFGMSRTKLKDEAAKQLLSNVSGTGIVYGTGGGDHSKNFKQLYELANERGGKLIVGVTPKSMDNDLAIVLGDGSKKFSLMLGYPTAAYVMRRHWFDELQSAAGAGRALCGMFFGRGAGWTVLGATRCDEEYTKFMEEQGILTEDLKNKMDSLGGKQIPLTPEYPTTIPEFTDKVNEVYAGRRDKTVGVAVSEGFMFKEVEEEYNRLANPADPSRLIRENGLMKMIGDMDFSCIRDDRLRQVFEKNPELVREFFLSILQPEYDVWGHPKLGFMPKLVHAVMEDLCGIETNYLEIKYEARTAETIPVDRELGEVTGDLAGEKLKAGESGLTTVLYEPGEDPLLIKPGKREAVSIPFSQISELTENDNTLLSLDKGYLRKLGVYIP